jgi:hypothetical protein
MITYYNRKNGRRFIATRKERRPWESFKIIKRPG